MKNNVSIKEAAELMGVSQQFLRIGLQQNVFSFGAALKLNGSSKFTYYISRKKLYEYIEVNGG